MFYPLIYLNLVGRSYFYQYGRHMIKLKHSIMSNEHRVPIFKLSESQWSSNFHGTLVSFSTCLGGEDDINLPLNMILVDDVFVLHYLLYNRIIVLLFTYALSLTVYYKNGHLCCFRFLASITQSPKM
ncbi:hypothetical protein BC833DRAFT_570730 [Globomyces pollinis-pini]|nr:hypothetical protein BC833DRAFT_570730 [Globomyces pollinis-pini]